MRPTKLGDFAFRTALALIAVSMLGATQALAEDKLLADTVDLAGTIIFLEAKVPGLVIGVVRNGETLVRGYGKIADDSDKEPDGDTLMRSARSPRCFAAQCWRAWRPTAASSSPTRCRTGSAGASPFPSATASRSG
jgi:hypothetical protein